MTETLRLVPHRKMDIYRCPNECGWYRAYNVDAWWLRKPIDHPFYGLVREEELIKLEIGDHDCGTYLAAHRRAKERRSHERDHSQDYNRYYDGLR